MKNLVSISILVGSTLAFVSAQDAFLESIQTQTLSEDVLGLPYDADLGCGACTRSGYMYCRTKSDDKGRDPEDRCC
jgi:hypothetical protein